MGVRLVLDTEQANLIVVKMVDFIDILRIDTLYGNIYVRLSGTQPHVAHQHVGDSYHLFALAAHR